MLSLYLSGSPTRRPIYTRRFLLDLASLDFGRHLLWRISRGPLLRVTACFDQLPSRHPHSRCLGTRAPGAFLLRTLLPVSLSVNSTGSCACPRRNPSCAAQFSSPSPSSPQYVPCSDPYIYISPLRWPPDSIPTSLKHPFTAATVIF